MTQKVLKVGSSAAVTLPKEMLKEAGLRIGDRVRVEFNEKSAVFIIRPFGVEKNKELQEWTTQFIKRYRPALEALAKK